MIEILMVDDHAIFRSGMRRLLSDEPDMRIVAEAANGQEAIECLRRRSYGLVLLDINMSGRSGLDTLRRIRLEWPTQAVILLSMYPEAQYAPMALQLGARGYLSKDRDATELLARARGRLERRFADTDAVRIALPSMLGVDYNAHVLESILKHVAPALGWR